MAPQTEAEASRADGARNPLATALVAVVALAVVGVTYWRLYYGVDVSDESFYVAVPYRLVRGARLFVDETSVAQQLVGILLYPFVHAYVSLVGVGGIVLFVRHLQFVFSLAVAASIAVGLRAVLPTRQAVLVALTAVAFVPFQIHSLSYNTVGGGLFTAGCLLGFASLREPGRWSLRLLAGLCHGVAVFAYPPLIVGVAACYLVRLGIGRRKATLALDLPALALPLAGLAAVVAVAGFGRVRADYRHSRTTSVQHFDSHKLVSVAAHEWHTLRFWYLVVPALALVALLWRRLPVAARIVVLVLPLLVLPTKLRSVTSSLEYVAHYGWLALFLLPLARRRPGAVELFAVCWLPALVAGAVTGYTSSNGGVNAGIGFFPAALVSSVFLIWTLGGRFATAPVLITLALLTWFELPVYRDGPVSTLHARVNHGAFAGLLTTAAKRDFLVRLEGTVGGFGSSCRIVFFDDFPAGYLLTRAQADTTTVWLHGRTPPSLIAYYRRHGFPDVVVELAHIPYSVTGGRNEHYRRSNPLLAMLRTRSYRLVASRRDYLVYRRSSGCSA